MWVMASKLSSMIIISSIKNNNRIIFQQEKNVLNKVKK